MQLVPNIINPNIAVVSRTLLPKMIIPKASLLIAKKHPPVNR